MDAITYTQARKNFSAIMNRVWDDHTPNFLNKSFILKLKNSDFELPTLLFVARTELIKNLVKKYSQLRRDRH